MAKRRQIRLPTRAERYWAKAPLPAVVKSVSTFGNENGPSCNELTGPNLTSDAPPEPYTLVYVPANHGGCIAALALTNGPLKSNARPAPVSMDTRRIRFGYFAGNLRLGIVERERQ